MRRKKAKVELSVIPSFDAGENVIEQLEQVLESAKAGKLSMVAIATVERDGGVGRTWSQMHNVATMIGSIEMMKRDLLKRSFTE